MPVSRVTSSLRRVLGLSVAVIVLVTGLSAAQLAADRSEPAAAADLRAFDPGYIISDENFFNSGAMDEGAVQQFLNGRIASCVRGYTCLRDFRQDTSTRPADRYCGQYDGAGGESAARIIVKTARACGINPQVLIVTLQKEQGLVTSREPTTGTYRIAMGYACPDTAACDARYFGFFNQVYSAARQFKVYQYATTNTGGPYFTAYAPGGWRNVQYHPEGSCGSSSVFIQNQATANLYYYTPYQPNGAALASGYGTGDGCSAYGNRNFFSYFSDWFGPPAYRVQGSIGAFWRSNGGANGNLGHPLQNEQTVVGGWKQRFSAGLVTTRSGEPVHVVRGAIGAHYSSLGEETNSLGWPTSSERQEAGGWVQDFTGGQIVVVGSRVAAVKGTIGALYRQSGGPAGRLGAPTGDERWSNGTWIQDFVGGRIQMSSAGTFSIVGDIGVAVRGLNPAAQNDLGAPVATEEQVGGRWQQRFSTGVVVVSGGEAWTVRGELGRAYSSLGGLRSDLGTPTGEQQVRSGGWSQRFTGGTLYSSSVGVHAVPTAIGSVLDANGGIGGSLGWPVGAAHTVAGTLTQRFSNGYLVAGSPGQVVKGAIAVELARGGGMRPVLGLPVGGERLAGGIWVQDFTSGQIVYSGSGAYTAQGSLGAAYRIAGGAEGPLGALTGQERAVSGGWRQTVRNGEIFSGPGGTHAVKGSILAAYSAGGSSSGRLGWPSGAELTVSGGWKQSFTGGWLFSASGGATVAVQGSIGAEYQRIGQEASQLSWPTRAEYVYAGNWRQDFRGGSILHSGLGSASVTGSIGSAYFAAGGPTSQAGWPLAGEQQVAGGWLQRFAAATYYASSAGTWVVQGTIGQTYDSVGGRDGRLGWPVGGERIVGGAWVQDFRGGSISVGPAGVSVSYR